MSMRTKYEYEYQLIITWVWVWILTEYEDLVEILSHYEDWVWLWILTEYEDWVLTKYEDWLWILTEYEDWVGRGQAAECRAVDPGGVGGVVLGKGSVLYCSTVLKINLNIFYYLVYIYNRPGVAKAVLQSPL